MNFESIISISLGLIGIITGLIFFLLSIRKKEFTYIIETENLITNDIAQYSGLEFFYNKNKVRNLSFGKVLIMNTGKEPITKKDLTTINPIALKFSENAKILYSSLIFQSSVSNQWKLFTQEGKNELYFQFDYLDYKQGVVIIFVYEADPNSKITIEGDIIGVEKLKKKKLNSFWGWQDLILNSYVFFMIPFTMVGGFFLFGNDIKEKIIQFIIFTISIFVLTILVSYTSKWISKKYYVIGIPKSLYLYFNTPIKELFR